MLCVINLFNQTRILFLGLCTVGGGIEGSKHAYISTGLSEVFRNSADVTQHGIDIIQSEGWEKLDKFSEVHPWLHPLM